MIVLIFADLRLLTTEQNKQYYLGFNLRILGLGSDMVRDSYETRYKRQAQGIAQKPKVSTVVTV